MDLHLEILGASPAERQSPARRTFTRDAVIGRSDECDWVIPDSNRYLSKRHARVTLDNGTWYLTDISRNGIRLSGSEARLDRTPRPIADGEVYRMGDFQVRASFVSAPSQSISAREHTSADYLIPDDAFLDPLVALVERPYTPGREAASTALQIDDHASIERVNLPMPELIPQEKAAPVAAPSPQSPANPTAFWERFAAELGVSLDNLDADAREALALRSAGLLKRCMEGLRQNLRTRVQLCRELHLSAAGQALGDLPHLEALLQPSEREPSASHCFESTLRELRTHQVAFAAASQAAMDAALEDFAPDRLVSRYERHGLSARLPGAHWRAYRRHHQALRQDGAWRQRLLEGAFASTYHDQLRLIATLDDPWE